MVPCLQQRRSQCLDKPQQLALAHDKAAPHLELDTVTTRGTSRQLVLQCVQLRRAGRGLVRLAQPVAQHVGLARSPQGA